MNKNDFLLAVHEYLKAFGYRKNKSYWFLSNGELVIVSMFKVLNGMLMITMLRLVSQ